MGGPFFNKRENQRHREEQEKARQLEEMRGMRGSRGGWGQPTKMKDHRTNQPHEVNIFSQKPDYIIPQ